MKCFRLLYFFCGAVLRHYSVPRPIFRGICLALLWCDRTPLFFRTHPAPLDNMVNLPFVNCPQEGFCMKIKKPPDEEEQRRSRYDFLLSKKESF